MNSRLKSEEQENKFKFTHQTLGIEADPERNARKRLLAEIMTVGRHDITDAITAAVAKLNEDLTQTGLHFCINVGDSFSCAGARERQEGRLRRRGAARLRINGGHARRARDLRRGGPE